MTTPLRPNHLRLGVNIDHVATIRNARGGLHPCPLPAQPDQISIGDVAPTASPSICAKIAATSPMLI